MIQIGDLVRYDPRGEGDLDDEWAYGVVWDERESTTSTMKHYRVHFFAYEWQDHTAWYQDSYLSGLTLEKL